MRIGILKALAGGLLLMLPQAAMAQPGGQADLPPPGLERGVAVLKSLDPPEVSKIIQKYAGMAGGWHIETRCQAFAAPLRREYEWYLSQMTVMLGQVIKREDVFGLQQSAQRAAADKPCATETTNKLILPAFADSKVLVKLLTGLDYSPQQQLIEDAKRATLMIYGQAVDDQCKYMPPEIRSEYDGNIRTITETLTRNSDPEVMAGIRSDVQKRLAVQPVRCEPAVRQWLMTAFGDSRAMVRP